MEKKRNMDQGFDWKKKKNGVASEGSALVKTSSTPSYAAGRDSLPTTTPYAPGLQAGVSSQPKPEKTEQAREPEIPKENETPPYVMGRDEGKPPTIPYGAGLQGGIKPQPPAQKPPNQSGNTEEEPYVMGRDEWEPPTIPYAAGLQGGVKPLPTVQKPTVPRGGTEQDPYIAGRDEVKTGLPYAAGSQAGIKPESPSKDEQSGPWLKKKAPQRTAKAVLEELNSLEQNYDDMLREAEAWESQAASQKTPEEISRWEKKGRELRQKAAELEPYLDTLQKEWKYAMDWEWEEKKKKEGYRDPTLWDMTVGSFQQGYNTAQFGKESYRDMLGEEDNRKAELEEKLAGEEYKFMPEGWWEKLLSQTLAWAGEEAYKALSPEALAAMAGLAGAAVMAGQPGPQLALPEEVVTVPGAAIMGNRAGSVATNMEVQAGLAYNKMRENGVPEETARDIAMIIGGVDGAIDMISMDSAIKFVKTLDASGVSEKAIELFGDAAKKAGVDIGPIIETTLKTKAQEGVSKAGVGIGTWLEGGTQTPTLKNTENIGTDTGKENPWISDDTARKLLGNQSMLDYLARWGDLKLTKGMKPEERISAVKKATETVIRKQEKASPHHGGKKAF